MKGKLSVDLGMFNKDLNTGKITLMFKLSLYWLCTKQIFNENMRKL